MSLFVIRGTEIELSHDSAVHVFKICLNIKGEEHGHGGVSPCFDFK